MAAWEETNLGVDALRDVMVPKGTKIAEMQIALVACPAAGVGGSTGRG